MKKIDLLKNMFIKAGFVFKNGTENFIECEYLKNETMFVRIMIHLNGMIHVSSLYNKYNGKDVVIDTTIIDISRISNFKKLEMCLFVYGILKSPYD